MMIIIDQFSENFLVHKRLNNEPFEFQAVMIPFSFGWCFYTQINKVRPFLTHMPSNKLLPSDTPEKNKSHASYSRKYSNFNCT